MLSNARQLQSGKHCHWKDIFDHIEAVDEQFDPSSVFHNEQDHLSNHSSLQRSCGANYGCSSSSAQTTLSSQFSPDFCHLPSTPTLLESCRPQLPNLRSLTTNSTINTHLYDNWMHSDNNNVSEQLDTKGFSPLSSFPTSDSDDMKCLLHSVKTCESKMPYFSLCSRSTPQFVNANLVTISPFYYHHHHHNQQYLGYDASLCETQSPSVALCVEEQLNRIYLSKIDPVGKVSDDYPTTFRGTF
jgi:hypothetical protein